MIKYSIPKVIMITLVSSTLAAVWLVYNAYVPLYLQGGNVALGESSADIRGFGLSPSATGFVMTLDNIVALILIPFIGIWSDGLKSKFGRRLPFVLIPLPFIVIGLLGVAFIPGFIPETLSGNFSGLLNLFIPFVIFLALILIANAVMTIPAGAMIYDWTPSEKRATTNAVVLLVGLAASLIIFGVSSVFYETYPPLPFIIVSSFLIVSVLWVWFAMKGAPEPGTVDENNLSLRQVLQSLRALPRERGISLGFLAGSDVFNYLALTVLEAFLTSYVVSKLGMDAGTAGGLLVVFFLMNVVLALPVASLANRFGRKSMRLAGFILISVGCSLMIFAPSAVTLYITLVVTGGGMTFLNIVGMPMWMDHMPNDQFIATISSAQFFTQTLSAIVGPILCGWIVESSGNNYDLIWPLAFAFTVIGVVLTALIKFGEIRKDVPIEPAQA